MCLNPDEFNSARAAMAHFLTLLIEVLGHDRCPELIGILTAEAKKEMAAMKAEEQAIIDMVSEGCRNSEGY